MELLNWSEIIDMDCIFLTVVFSAKNCGFLLLQLDTKKEVSWRTAAPGGMRFAHKMRLFEFFTVISERQDKIVLSLSQTFVSVSHISFLTHKGGNLFSEIFVTACIVHV